MTKKDGGSAFPRFELDSGAGGCVGGMTLRDYFAAAALQGMCADGTWSIRRQEARELCGETAYGQKKNMAKTAFEYADAMLAERNK